MYVGEIYTLIWSSKFILQPGETPFFPATCLLYIDFVGVGSQTGNEGGGNEELNWYLYTSIFKENMEYICIIILFISGSARLPSALNSKTYPLIIIFP